MPDRDRPDQQDQKVSKIIREIRSVIPTIGERYEMLEEGTQGLNAMHLLAIKNNMAAFNFVLAETHKIPSTLENITLQVYDACKTSLNCRDIYGNTPLHYFALRGRSANRKQFSGLLRLGGDMLVKNNAGESVVEVMRVRCITLCHGAVEAAVTFDARQMTHRIIPWNRPGTSTAG